MTASLDARTPSADVHALSGSSRPGAVPPLAPLASVHELPDPFVPLGDAATGVVAGLAARRAAAAHPDAEVIELAGRVVRLAERDHRAHGRLADVMDRVTSRVGFPPKTPTPPIGLEMKTEIAGDLEITTMTRPLETPERDAIFAAHDQALAEHERRTAALGARLGLPALDKRVTRMFARLVRWTIQLAAMAPATQAGLRAKAEAQLVVERCGNFDDWTQNLASSVGRDALRLATALCEPRDDAELHDLIAQHKAALEKWDALDEAWTGPATAYEAVKPERPRALYWRMLDRFPIPKKRQSIPGSDSYRLLYEQSDIDAMRESETPCGLYFSHPDKKIPGPVSQWLPDPQAIERKAEILAAWDAWEAEKATLKDSCGLTAINDEIAAQSELLNDIEDRAFDYLPRTFEGLQAKARWIASGFCPKQRAEHMLRDLCRMPPMSLAPPAQVAPTREVIETYRAFLEMEFRFLNWETHGTAGPSGGIWLDNPIGSLHGGDGPLPSSRAIAVLTTLGLMPDSASEAVRKGVCSHTERAA